MTHDAQFMRLLAETFRAELQDQAQRITDGLLGLEKASTPEEAESLLQDMFRGAHNIKGAAGGVHAREVGELAHALESLFGWWRAGQGQPDAALVDLSLLALDHMRFAAAPEAGGAAPRLSRAGVLAQLREAVQEHKAPATASAPTALPVEEASQPDKPVVHEAGASTETIRVPMGKLLRVSALADELQVVKITLSEHVTAIQAMHDQMAKLEARMRLARTAPRGSSRARGRSSPVPAGGGPGPVFRPAAPTDDAAMLAENAALLGELKTTSARLSKLMRGNASRLGLLSAALQTDLRLLQLVPIAVVLRPMARMVRDIARELGKQVELRISDDQIELDRAVLNGLRDPLLHLLRNAIDHGIETPEARRTAGKAEEGLVTLDVSSAGGRIRLELRDDGHGIDVDEVVRIALRKKIVQPEEAERLDAQARLELIFRPGFSSKDIITHLSGRGVGLDVVLANLRQLQGHVRVETQVGRGTLFRLDVPLTFSTERGLHVVAGGEDMVIPSTSVERIIEIGLSDVLALATRQMVMVGGKPVPLRELAATLELPTGGFRHHARIPVVVVSRGWAQVAFMVEDVVGAREIVVKRLLPPLGLVRHVSGATVTGSGEVMMVLNASELVDTALSQSAPASLDMPDEPTDTAPQRVLVVDDSITTRALEKNILEAHGYAVTVAGNGQQAWELLQSWRFALVVTDVEMPVMDGFELTHRIRGLEAIAETPVILVTSLASEEDRRRGVEVGADAYFVKSEFESRSLLEVVRQLI